MDEAALVENRTFDDGESASFERAVTRGDIELFAAVSGDANPTHLDEAFAKQVNMRGIVAHGMLTAGLISNLLSNRLPGAGTVYVSQELQFAAPVHADDTVKVTVTAREKEPRRKLVRFDCSCTNQEGAVVLTGLVTVIAPTEKQRRPGGRARPAAAAGPRPLRGADPAQRGDSVDHLRRRPPVRGECAQGCGRGRPGRHHRPDPGRTGGQDRRHGRRGRARHLELPAGRRPSQP